MAALDKILELLKDGRWHKIEEIKEKAKLQEDKLEKITEFLAEYEFIQLDKKRKKARLTSLVLNFLTKTQQTS